MDASDKPNPDLLGVIKSLFPKRTEPAHVSRDFWMPDHSCLVCYECDSQFTLFNRRHHCRLCGRVFCSKCTSNFIPVPSSDQSATGEEKIRVCNFCFKQQEQGFVTGNDQAIPPSCSDISLSSPSVRSFVSTRSSGTVNSGSATIASESQSELLPHQSSAMEVSLDRQDFTKALSNDCAAYLMYHNQSPNPFQYCMNRSDDDDEDFGVYTSDPQSRQHSQINGCYGNLLFDEVESDHDSREVHPDRDIQSKSMSGTSPHSSFDLHASEEVHKIIEEVVPDCEEREPPSSTYVAESVDTEPVDFENNGVLWLPPEPEDKEDEREATLFDDDDDGDVTGEWRQFRTSSSFGSGEFRSRDRSNEEHKNAVKNVVDGHFRALVAQLLQVENLPVGEEGDKESWLEIITSLSWEGATLLKPDTSKGGGMDPGGYVKIKCLASGRRSDSTVVKGVVCKKNVAHRRMTSNLEKPRILILGGALEYQRVSNLLSSFDTLLQQEMDHQRWRCKCAHHPDILLVEKSVSRYAQEYLLAKDISLVLNIKRPLLERIARCTGGQIVPSIDHLSSQKLGYCDQFYVKRSLEEHGTAGQNGKKLVKTLMYFEGCPKPLGCTVLLRGANGDELKKVKHVVQYGIFAAYHLGLETSFLADEGASLPQLPLNSPITVALPDKTSSIDRSISTIPGFTLPVNEKSLGAQSVGQPPTSQSDASALMTRTTGDPISYANPSVSSSGHYVPYSYLDGPSPCGPSESLVNPNNSHDTSSSFADTVQIQHNLGHSDAPEKKEVFSASGNDCSEVDATRACADLSSAQVDGKHVLEAPVSLKEEFPPSPSDHQSILVSLSSRCVWKGTVCERSHLFRIKYYSNFDKPLGRYLRDHLFDQSYRCRFCEMPSEAHVQCYTHHQGTLTISVKKLPEILLPGEKDSKIWMWHRCLKCPRINGFPPATQRIVMSDAAWGLSFGKFLELSFSNHAAASRVASCGHSLHRDCLRFYGFGKMVACFRYASIDVHSVYLPPSKLDFNYENQDWIQNELNQVVGKAALMFSDVVNALRLLAERRPGIGELPNNMKVPKGRSQIADLESMLQKEMDDFEKLVEHIENKEMKKAQPALDILDINRLRRQLLFQSYLWDHRLQQAAALESKASHDDIDVKLPEFAKKSLSSTKLGDLKTVTGSVNNLSGIDTVLVDANGDETQYQRLEGNYTDQQEMLHECGGTGNPLAIPSGESSIAESNLMDKDITVRRTLSDGQYPVVATLSETLDAAWTGENNAAVGIVKDDISHCSETAERDFSTAGGMAEKLVMEDQVTEDTMSWLGMPFVSFYRSFNKSLSGNVQRMENFNGYNPVYMSSFWESDAQGGSRYMFPVGMNDTVVPVYDDEPTSIISYALLSPDYLVQLSDETERLKDTIDSMGAQHINQENLQYSQSADEAVLQSYRSLVGDESFMSSGSRNSAILDPHSHNKTLHARVLFDHPLGEVKYNVTCYYAKRFEALRKICCPSEIDFVRSLSRCKKWGAQGGKSNVFFAKTLDERFIIKQVTKTELESFLKFAPEYFKYLSESIVTGSPTCLAKILGIYQVTTKSVKGGKELKMDLLVMENLLFGRNLTRLYDLKGSSRSRYNADSSGSNKVLLDQNLIEAMPTSPIFVGNKAKRLLERAVWNDTAFLASVDVMDYSLLVGIDEERHELVLGIIDFMRQYTWDKHLETWVKASAPWWSMPHLP
ncbi:hypothetical protein Leryth_012606 [Lithospermum erythrorhizon]|nr:hypothetical protein Leryth_012606 [Lithospermum erythrorhizon]